MKKYLLLAVLLICSVAYAQSPGIKGLYLLAGKWEMKTKKGTIGESWKKMNANELQSTGYEIKGKDTTWLEKVQLIKKSDGIYYIPTVKNENGGKPVPFKLISSVNSEFIFSNPEHDFPQRVIYHLVKPDSLHAWIDGQYKGKYVKQDFYYHRVK
ncbi:hypothetical protein BEL04_00730 [Mucilaginibacter sp. PPCGB 2223]|uniref:DUF6265 family protein n=1 Tax=Mucilaginibacter sp. PPCGB 2223 TaxID=1886027 RepID=UPI000823FE7D|nr:DUF6265 family protein [Mucilaginibacter sp. PPCGB 2223]OCX52888.1 hypothetical protein BEL04_00730 [Mucilaginibacter sp. PPCGB 2223]